MRDLIPKHTKCYLIKTALKGGVLNPPANKEMIKVKYNKFFKFIFLIFLIFTAASNYLFALSADDYRTNTADPLIRNIPASIRNLRTRGADVYLERVAEYITEHAVNEFDKVKKAHDWVALNIRYNTSAFFSGRIPSQSVSNVISSGLAVCAGYAEVFNYLCRLLGVECEIIEGYARGYGSSLFGSENPYNTNHAWNKVKIYDNWYLIDTTWNSGYVNNNRGFTARYKTEYLFANPYEFVHSHFPVNPRDQLLDVPIISAQFMRLPKVGAPFFERIANLTPSLERITPIKGRFFRFDFTSPVNHHFMFNIYNQSGGSRLTNILSSSVRNGVNTVQFSFQRAGNYFIWIYSSANPRATHDGIAQLGFSVEIPDVTWGSIPGDAELISPESQSLTRNTHVEFKLSPGKWKYITLINGTNWRYLTPDEDGIFTLNYYVPSSGTVYLAGSETESGFYETLAVFNIR